MAFKSKACISWCTVRRAVVWLTVVVITLVVGLLILIFRNVPRPVVHIDPAAAVQLNARLKQAEASASPTSPQVLRVEQTELNSLFASYLGRDPNSNMQVAPTPVRDLRLVLIKDRIHMYLAFDFHGKDLTFELEGKVRTVNGFAEFEPLSGKLGALPIPKSALQSSMHRMMESPRTREALRLPSNLSDVHVEEGRIVATFK